MFGSGYENCPEFGVLGGVIFKLDILQTGRKFTVLRERFRLHLPHITCNKQGNNEKKCDNTHDKYLYTYCQNTWLMLWIIMLIDMINFLSY